MGQTVISAPVVQTGQYYPYDPVKNPLGQKTWTQYFATSYSNNASYYGYNFSTQLTGRIQYLGGYYVFTDYYAIYYSADGKVWNTQLVPMGTGNQIYGLAYNGTTWVIAGANGALSTASSLGGAWTARTSAMSGAGVIRDLRWLSNANLFAWCGYTPNAGTCLIATSPDGITWTNRYNQVSSEQYFNIGIDDTTGTYVASNSNNSASNTLYSTNGTSWTLTDANGGGQGGYAQFIKGAFNKWVSSAGGTLFTSSSANVGSAWYSQTPNILFHTPFNSMSYGTNTGVITPTYGNPRYSEFYYDSVNNYYYQLAMPTYNTSTLGYFYVQPPVLITYNAATLLTTSYNTATNYYQAFPMIKEENLPQGITGAQPQNYNFNYGYVNGVHIYTVSNQVDRTRQIWTTA